MGTYSAFCCRRPLRAMSMKICSSEIVLMASSTIGCPCCPCMISNNRACDMSGVLSTENRIRVSLASTSSHRGTVSIIQRATLLAWSARSTTMSTCRCDPNLRFKCMALPMHITSPATMIEMRSQIASASSNAAQAVSARTFATVFVSVTVRREQQAPARVVADVLHHGPHVATRRRIDTGAGLVEHDDRSACQHGDRHRQLPLHAARVRLRRAIGADFQADALDKVFDDVVANVRRDTQQTRVHVQVTAPADLRHERCVELWHVRDALAGLVGRLSDVDAAHSDRAQGRRLLAQHALDRRRLPGSIH